MAESFYPTFQTISFPQRFQGGLLDKSSGARDFTFMQNSFVGHVKPRPGETERILTPMINRGLDKLKGLASILSPDM